MKKRSILTQGEINTLIKLLPKLRWPLPYPVFVALCKSVPVIAVDLAIMENPDRVLLTYRKDEFYDNWHIPGMILRYTDTVLDRLECVAKDELGIGIKNIRFVGYMEYRDARECAIGLLFTASPVGRPCDGKFFDLKHLPNNFLSSQLAGVKLLRGLKK